MAKPVAKIQSVARALKIIDILADAREEMALNQISNRLNLAKSTVHGLISTLKDFGYIEQSVFNGKYRLGVRLFELGGIVAEGWEIREVAAPYIQSLLENARETVHLVVLDNYEVLYIDKRESSQSLRIVSQIGMRLPAHCTGVGKVLLAHLSIEERDKLISAKGLPQMTRNTITDRAQLASELETIRKQGYAVDREEVMDNLVCVAAPIRDQSGDVISAISISGPKFRLKKELFDKAVQLVIRAGKDISTDLGYREKNKNINLGLKGIESR